MQSAQPAALALLVATHTSTAQALARRLLAQRAARPVQVRQAEVAVRLHLALERQSVQAATVATAAEMLIPVVAAAEAVLGRMAQERTAALEMQRAAAVVAAAQTMVSMVRLPLAIAVALAATTEAEAAAVQVEALEQQGPQARMVAAAAAAGSGSWALVVPVVLAARTSWIPEMAQAAAAAVVVVGQTALVRKTPETAALAVNEVGAAVVAADRMEPQTAQVVSVASDS